LTTLAHNRRIFLQEVLTLSRSRRFRILILPVCVVFLVPTAFAQPQAKGSCWSPRSPSGSTRGTRAACTL